MDINQILSIAKRLAPDHITIEAEAAIKAAYAYESEIETLTGVAAAVQEMQAQTVKPKGKGLISQLREQIAVRGISTLQAAEEIGVHPSSLYAWLNGRNQPQGAGKAKIAKYLEQA